MPRKIINLLRPLDYSRNSDFGGHCVTVLPSVFVVKTTEFAPVIVALSTKEMPANGTIYQSATTIHLPNGMILQSDKSITPFDETIHPQLEKSAANRATNIIPRAVGGIICTTEIISIRK